jgi:hypothetical protein
MRQLYQQAYKRVAQRVADSSGSLPQALQGFQHDILHRLPREDFKAVIKSPCFVKKYPPCDSAPRRRCTR